MHSYLIQSSPQQALKVAQSYSSVDLSQPHPDVFRLEPELSIGIEQVREAKQFLTTPPFQAQQKIILILQAETLTLEAQNALLKTLEEPPAYAIIILTTQYPDQLLPTVVSRCQLIQPPQELNEPDLAGMPELANKLEKGSIANRVNQAAAYTKRDQAIDVCQKLTHYYRGQLPAVPALKNLQLLEKSLMYLKANTHPQLTIEVLFLNLR